MAELMRHDGALLLLAEELENALRHHDARIGAQQAIGEGGRVAVGNEADPRRGEAIVVGHLMDELVNARIALPDRGVVEELELLNQRSVRSDSHGLISQISKLMTTVSPMASVKLTSPAATMAASTRPTTMPIRMPKVTREAKTRRATTIPQRVRASARRA